MNDLDLADLDIRIDSLLRDRQHLKVENQSLRQRLFRLTQERAQLQDKNLIAASKIKRVLSQLRSDINE
jgi:uncharacterized protein (TIGR02449 family)